jgi:hypothetical protein
MEHAKPETAALAHVDDSYYNGAFLGPHQRSGDSARLFELPME